mgnify:CR=1 FL=1
MVNYIGDATEVMSTMSEDQYGAVVTSPPYNIGIDYGNYKDNMKDADYQEKSVKKFGMLRPALTDGRYAALRFPVSLVQWQNSGGKAHGAFQWR